MFVTDARCKHEDSVRYAVLCSLRYIIMLAVSIHYGIKHGRVPAEAIFNSIRNVLAMGSSEFLCKCKRDQQQQCSRNTKINIILFDCHVTIVWTPQQNFIASDKVHAFNLFLKFLYVVQADQVFWNWKENHLFPLTFLDLFRIFISLTPFPTFLVQSFRTSTL